MKGTLAAIIMSAVFLFAAGPAAAAKWSGVDKTVVERYAEEHGRAARVPYINTDKGDLLLFMFLIAGAAGGFMAGYYWRTLTEKKASSDDKKYEAGAD